MKNVVIYQCCDSKNRGYEVIVKTMSENIKNREISTNISLISSGSHEDSGLNLIDNFWTRDKLRKGSLSFFIFRLIKKNLKRSCDDMWLKHTKLTKKIKGYDLALAVGDDNYSYRLGIDFWGEDKIMKKYTKKTMLMGCSIEPSQLNENLINHLQNFDVITAREKITYNALCKNGLGNKTIFASDAAFLLKGIPPEKYTNYFDKQVVGINVNSLSRLDTNDKNIFFDSIINMINEIINTTIYNILLIPYVESNYEDNIEILYRIAKKYKATNRINVLDDIKLSCEEVKWYISKCELFIGESTHSTIAAYSSHVPTLAIGCSVQSKGIAVDLFGKYENYIISMASMKDPNKLSNSFRWLNKNSEYIRNELEEIMPRYKEFAYKTVEQAIGLLEN